MRQDGGCSAASGQRAGPGLPVVPPSRAVVRERKPPNALGLDPRPARPSRTRDVTA
ncbi:hypothetical protein [Falsiroseomonas sp.]|uniref:hypothetical protein n=1 Tax=Falsiroseomonas sp. TaxID=2870721 RepID=UPI003563698E